MNKKISIFRVLYIINIFLILTIFAILIIKYQKSKIIKTEDFNFKIFEYQVSSILKTSINDDYRFSIKKDKKWFAEIEILVDESRQCIDSVENNLINLNLKEKIYKKEYNGIEFTIAKVNEKNRNILFCYYQTPSRYLYEIGIYNNDNSYDDTALEIISNILKNAKYHSEREGIFYYHVPNC